MTSAMVSAGRTEVGKVRRRNEDAILVRNDAGLWVVADGLGGHADGDRASRLIVERLAKLPRRGDAFDFIEAIEDVLFEVNAELRHQARLRAVDLIGSTVVVLVHGGGFSLCGWAGDSRGYCWTNGRLSQITRDHLYGVAATDHWSGGPGQSQPGGGMLTRAVGADHALFMDWAVARNGPGTRFVLCSDGINKEMSDLEIASACSRHGMPGGILDELFETSLQRGARDNLSAVVVSLPGAATIENPAADLRMEAINRALQALDDSHRRGEREREDYRAERRRLLGDLDKVNPGSSGDPPRPAAWKRWLGRG